MPNRLENSSRRINVDGAHGANPRQCGLNSRRINVDGAHGVNPRQCGLKSTFDTVRCVLVT